MVKISEKSETNQLNSVTSCVNYIKVNAPKLATRFSRQNESFLVQIDTKRAESVGKHILKSP